LHLPATVRPPPVCTGCLPFSLAFRSALQLAPPADHRLCLPTQPPTLIGCQILRPAFQSISSLRLPSIFQPSLPANRLTRVSDQPSSSAFQPACDRRHIPVFRPAFRVASGLRPGSSSGSASRWSPACAFRQRSAPPSNLTSDSHRLLYSPGAALWLICDRRRLSTFRPCPRTQPPTLIVRCIPMAAFRLPCGLRLRSTFQPRLRIRPSTHQTLCPFGAVFRFPRSSRRRSTLQPSLWTQPPTYRMPYSPVVRSG